MKVAKPLTVDKLRQAIELFGDDVIPDWDKFYGPTNGNKDFHRPECLCDQCLQWIVDHQYQFVTTKTARHP